MRPTGRAEAKAGPSDPPVLRGRAGDQRIKATPGITLVVPLPGNWEARTRLITGEPSCPKRAWGNPVGSQERHDGEQKAKGNNHRHPFG